VTSQAKPGPREARLERERRPLLRFAKLLGPGLITGAADDDPSGIGTYSINGAQLGFTQLWVGVYSIPLMVAVQEMSSRIGLVCGEGLAGVLRRHYPRWVAYAMVFGLVASSTITAGADIGAIAEAIHLLVPLPAKAMVLPIAAGIVLTLVFGGYRLINGIFKWLVSILFAYVGAGLLAGPDWGAALRGTLVPTVAWDGQSLSNIVALLGATGSPYLMFWQASQEVEEEVEMGRTSRRERRGETRAELRYSLVDVVVGMVVSQVIAYFVQLSTAATLHRAGQRDVESAAQAAEALRPLAGDAATTLFAVGLISAGLLAVPILVSGAGLAVAELFGWPANLSAPFGRAKGFYGVIAAATGVGLAINFVGLNPLRALFLASLLFGLLTPPLVLVMLLVTNNRRIMGDRVNGRWLNAIGGVTLLTNTAAAVGFLLTARGQ
jgi:NRAMP (natural resistance-associated macrophage protein)-like metal ion transporter